MRKNIHVNFVTNKSSKLKNKPYSAFAKDDPESHHRKVPSTLFHIIATRGRILSARTFAILHAIENEWNPNISILTTSA